MRRALLLTLAIAFAIACGDDITEPTTAPATGTTAVGAKPLFATTTTEDGLSISTDKDDYQPGDTVHFTGSGWQPGDVLDIVLTDDPLTHDPHTWTVNVDADGTFQDDTYVVDEGDLDVKFTLVATSRANGRSLTVQFTDANIANNGVVVVPGTRTVTVGMTASYTVNVTFGGSGDACTANLSVTGLQTGAVGTLTPSSVTGLKDETKSSNLTITTTGVAPATRTFTVMAAKGAGCDGNDRTGTGVLVVQAPTVAATTLSVSPAAGIEGGNTSFSATLTRTSDASALSGQTISFTLNGVAVGTATTNASGVAAVTGVSLAGIAVGTYSTAIGASFAGATGFAASSGTGSLTVTAKTPLTGSFTVSNKPYDGNTSATITGRALAGVVGSDNVTLTGGAATFDTKNAGTSKTVTGTGFTLSGSDAGKYTLVSSTLTTTADITPITLTGHFTAGNKVYDGNTDASITGRTLTGGVIGTENVSLSGGTATFANKSVGTGKAVTGTGFSLAGADAGNYSLASSTLSTTASITVRDLTVTATGQNKIYDGTTDAQVTLSDDRIDGDVLTASYTNASFTTKTVGSAKPISVAGISISGPDAGNYHLTNTTATASANITPVTLNGQFTADNKVYDATDAATILTRTLGDGIIKDDDVSLDGGVAKFANKNVGTGKAVTGTGFLLSGGDAGNYVLASTTLTTTANITPKDLTVSATADNKIYDGTDDATVHLTDDRLSGDVVTFTYTAKFNNKNVGNGKPVSVTNITLGGADGVNYHLTSTTAASSANITQLDVTGHFTVTTKEYDGTTAAEIASRTITPAAFTGDDATLSGGTANFADKNAGIGKSVTGTGFSLAGVDAGNYHLLSGTLITTGNIDPRPVTVTADGKSKFFGDPDPALTYQLTAGTLVGTDAFSGALSRVAGETVAGSPYAIQKGSLTLGPNYDITFVGANLVIKAWTLSGFYAPVDMPRGEMMLNSIKGGQSVPLKFEVFVGNTERTDVAAVKSFTQSQVTCPMEAATDAIEVTSTGGTVLRYDATAGQFIQNWQTPKTAGKCYRVTMTTLDDSSVYAYFKTK